MVWAPSMRVWAGEEVKVEEAELEAQAPMEGVEEEGSASNGDKDEASANGKSKEQLEAEN